MKKLLLTILILISINATSQVKTLFENEPIESIELFRDSVKMALPSTFTYKGFRSAGNIYSHVYADSLGNSIGVQYRKGTSDVNTKAIIIRPEIDGSFAELFLIWKRYFDPNADIEKIKKNRSARLGKIRFGSYVDDGWVIHSYY